MFRYSNVQQNKTIENYNFFLLKQCHKLCFMCMQECIKCVCKSASNVYVRSRWTIPNHFGERKFIQLNILLFPYLWIVGANILMMNFTNFACVSACWCKYVCEGMGGAWEVRLHLFVCMLWKTYDNFLGPGHQWFTLGEGF